MLGLPLLLQLRQADGSLRPFHGVVTRFALLGSDGGKTRYELMAEPWLAVLQWRTDSRVFSDKTVVEIVEAVFARYAGQGRLQPAWRWALADASVYPRRSRCHQVDESDLQFVCRLLAEEGIFFAVEHAGDPASPGLGSHTLLLCDHNALLREASPGALRMGRRDTTTLDEDRVHAWTELAELVPDSLELASYDYRSDDTRPVVAQAEPRGGIAMPWRDVPGAYAYETRVQGERLARRWLEALRLRAEHFEGEANVRTLGPLQRFTITDAYAGDPGPFVGTWLRHRGRSNLGGDASARAQLQRWEDDLPDWVLDAPAAGRRTEGPQYALEIRALRATTPLRPPAGALGPDVRPVIRGIHTAIVVGDGTAPVHTDRDHRVRVQHHWQRGSLSSHRLEADDASPGGDNAPADTRSGTWVPVVELQAGRNGGTSFLPRVGQEVALGYSIFKMTHDPLSLGLLGLAEAVPFIALALFGGHVADRFDKKRILLLSLSVILIASLVLIVATSPAAGLPQGTLLAMIYGTIMLIGFAKGFYGPAASALPPFLVPPEVFANATTWQSSFWQAATMRP